MNSIETDLVAAQAEMDEVKAALTRVENAVAQLGDTVARVREEQQARLEAWKRKHNE